MADTHRSLSVRRFALTTLACTVVAGGVVAFDNARFFTTQSSVAPATGGDEHASPIEVWFVRDGSLALTHQPSSAGITINEETGGTIDNVKQVEDALKRLFAAPPPELARGGLASAIPQGTQLLSVDVSLDGASAIVVVDVSPEFLAAEDRELATAQIVFTATQLSRVNDVRITVEGEPFEMPGDDRDEFDVRTQT